MSRFPETLTLPADVYDKLFALVTWANNTPANVELSDRTWDRISDLMTEPLDPFINSDECVVSVQIETSETSQRGIKPGTLVALMEDPEIDDEGEFHVQLLRGVT